MSLNRESPTSLYLLPSLCSVHVRTRTKNISIKLRIIFLKILVQEIEKTKVKWIEEMLCNILTKRTFSFHLLSCETHRSVTSLSFPLLFSLFFLCCGILSPLPRLPTSERARRGRGQPKRPARLAQPLATTAARAPVHHDGTQHRC
jgi:hypothetical protein